MARFGRILVAVTAAVFYCGLGESVALAQTGPSAASRLKLIADDVVAPSAVSGPPPSASPPSTYPSTPTPKSDSLPPPSPQPPAGAVNDPTFPDPSIRVLLDGGTANTPAAPQGIPEISLRARVVAAGKPASAMIQFGSSDPLRPRGRSGDRGAPAAPASSGQVVTYRTIREGDEFVAPGDNPTPIRVEKLTATEVVLELVNRKIKLRLD